MAVYYFMPAREKEREREKGLEEAQDVSLLEAGLLFVFT